MSEKHRILAIDIETYSDVDLPKSGVYAYSDSSNFTVLLFAYAFDDEETKIVDIAYGEQMPHEVLDALTHESVIKTAYNAAFERICLSKFLGIHLSPTSWQCTAVQSAMLALPRSLDDVGEVLDIKRKKLKEGADLVRYFSLPCKPTKANSGRTRNLPKDAPEKWERFKNYCIRDVDAEREIRWKLRNFPISSSETELYRLDQEINDRGILIDRELVVHAVKCDLQYKGRATARAYELTGLPKLIDRLPQIIDSIVNFIVNNLPLIIELGIKIVVELAAGLIHALPQLISKIPQIMTSIVTGFAKYYSNMGQVGVHIVEGLWEGIKSMGSWIQSKVTNFFGGIVDSVKGMLGIHSPSTVFAGIGGYMAQGLGIGFSKAIDQVSGDIQAAIPINFDLNASVSGNTTGRILEGSSHGGGFTLHIENFVNNTEKDIQRLAYEFEFYRQQAAAARGNA